MLPQATSSSASNPILLENCDIDKRDCINSKTPFESDTRLNLNHPRPNKSLPHQQTNPKEWRLNTSKINQSLIVNFFFSTKLETVNDNARFIFCFGDISDTNSSHLAPHLNFRVHRLGIFYSAQYSFGLIKWYSPYVVLHLSECS